MLKQKKDKLAAFKRVYDANAATLIRFARRFILSEQPEDIVQDVFLELWESDRVTDEAAARSFLFTAVRNRCINILKHEQIKENYEQHVQTENQLLGLDYLDSIEKLLIDKEEIQTIYQEIDRLPAKCRQIFKLAYFEDKKSAEIAQILNLSIRTVEHQLYLGLKTLRERLIRK
ncbi:MAG: RNA polymerase sigma-70 factor [Tannerella sp.]|jgi:RNA polymerase sigma-70 factor (ECF subfamily)|nr:RNA polymerase sigma-70 factor [Tannerella sp.]